MKNKMILKIKYFFKKNAYTLAVMLCVALAVTMISITAVAYTSEDEVVLPVISVVDQTTTEVGGNDVILFETPVKDVKIVREYAEDHLVEDKTTGDWKVHQAVDFAGGEGTEVFVVFDGTVEKVEESMMDGLCVTIDHGTGLKTTYKCLSSDAEVEIGDTVKKGQKIGTISTNLTEKADGAHLHFELRKDGELVDPMGYFADLSK